MDGWMNGRVDKDIDNYLCTEMAKEMENFWDRELGKMIFRCENIVEL